MIVARAWQFLLLLVIVSIILVYSISVTFHFFAHREMNSSRAKRLRFFVRARARRGNLFASLIIDLFDMNFLHVITAQAHVPALGTGDFGAKSTWLRCVTHWRG